MTKFSRVDTGLAAARTARAFSLKAFAVLLTAMPLAACSSVDRTVTGSIPSPDYRETHPIVLANQPISLDIFVMGRGLDAPSISRLKEFARTYRDLGRGPIAIQLPHGSPADSYAAASLDQIRRALAAGGATGHVSVSNYPVADPNLAAPVRLSYVGLKAKVATRCGEWPTDLGSASSVQGWNNRPYWNYGCSTQNYIAAQVSDPRDLAGPRAETPADTEMRSRAITNVRKGQDPGTKWETKNTAIGATGSN